jgi:hypothetical protein
MNTSDSTRPCWRPELLSNSDGTPRSPKDLLEPMTPDVMYQKYRTTPDGAVPRFLLPTFTPWYAEQYLFIGPTTPGTPWTPGRTPRSPQTPKIDEANKLYHEHYYWYWLLDPLFNYANEEQQGIIEEIRIDAMFIGYSVITQQGKLEEYERIARTHGVSKPNESFLDEVFAGLKTKYKEDKLKLSIVEQIKGDCAYAAASGQVKVTDIPSVSFAVMNEAYEDDAGSVRSASPGGSAGSVGSDSHGGSTRRRVKTIKKYKKRTRRRNNKRKSRKTRTTRRKP